MCQTPKILEPLGSIVQLNRVFHRPLPVKCQHICHRFDMNEEGPLRTFAASHTHKPLAEKKEKNNSKTKQFAVTAKLNLQPRFIIYSTDRLSSAAEDRF